MCYLYSTVLEVVLEIKKGKGAVIIKEIEECKRKFLNFQKLERYAEHQNNTKHFVLVTYGVDHLLSHNDVEKLKTRYAKINNVQCVTINQATNEFRSNISTKNCHFVFDVDSTLTTGRGTIQNKVRNIFNKMKDDDSHRVYLASGRSMGQLRQDMTDFQTEDYGIAENGGILLSFGRDGYLLISDRVEPDKVLHYMKTNRIKIKEDIEQGFRLTERIFHADVPAKQFLEYVEKSGAKVTVLASKTSFHVTKEKIDKGFALEKLRTKLRLGYDDVIIGVGDSDLDISLLKESDYKFAVGNASRRTKSVAVNLRGDFADGIKEMYEQWFKLL